MHPYHRLPLGTTCFHGDIKLLYFRLFTSVVKTQLNWAGKISSTKPKSVEHATTTETQYHWGKSFKTKVEHQVTVCSYEVRTDDGVVYRRNRLYLRTVQESFTIQYEDTDLQVNYGEEQNSNPQLHQHANNTEPTPQPSCSIRAEYRRAAGRTLSNSM